MDDRTRSAFVLKIIEWVFISFCCLSHSYTIQCTNELRVNMLAGAYAGYLFIITAYIIRMYYGEGEFEGIVDVYFMILGAVLFLVGGLIAYDDYSLNYFVSYKWRGRELLPFLMMKTILSFGTATVFLIDIFYGFHVEREEYYGHEEV